MTLDAKVPSGPIEKKWDNARFDLKLVNPANKRRFEVIVVADATAAAQMSAKGLKTGYADCLVSGLWPSLDVLPEEERAARGRPLRDTQRLWPRVR